MLAGLDSNDAVQFLALGNSTPWVKEGLYFFFCVGILASVPRSKTLVSTLALAFLRAFGDVSIALALGLNGMPGEAFKNLDWNMNVLLAALVWTWFSDSFIPADFSAHVRHLTNFAYSVVKANNAGLGYAAAGAALPGSFWAPFFGAYVAVNGARLLEKGMGAVRAPTDADDILAVLSGLIIFAVTHEILGGSATFARAVLVLFSFAGNWVNWVSRYNQVVAFVRSLGGAQASAKKTMKKK